jgi:cbb3-type cytochrome oxidase subunit 3
MVVGLSQVKEVSVRAYFQGSPEEFEEWIEQLESKYADHDVKLLYFTFYTNWFNIVSYAVHEYLLRTRDRIVREIMEKLEEEGFEPSVNVYIESEGLNRRYVIYVEARKKRVLYLGLPIIVRIAQILPRLLQIVINALTAILVAIGIVVSIELIRGFVDITIKVVETAREVAYQTGRGLAILVLLALAYIIYREVRR